MATGVPLLPPPGPVDINGSNASANWDFAKFDLYLTAAGQTSAADAVKSTFLLSSTKEKFSDVVALFRRYCSPKRKTTYERFMFSQRKWEEGVKFDNFLTSLKTLVHNCEFADQEDSMI
ncbi:hypothetical protein PR048_003731 [Dryococelus australis]|uniref:Uncharacterized protein n=1 Tax=Dryococelus australis TaxID=614101 RepID=A0ABQ9IPS9_9NEOP|nr:hypothetical protein PR048_003731 [Dryococelus australis]